MYLLLKNTHTLLAFVTISGFLLRGYWMVTGSDYLSRKATRIAPHVVDTLFLLSGIALIYMLSLPIAQSAWLLAKLAGLVVYIVLGAIALRRGPDLQVRLVAFVGAVATFAYVVGAAIAKSPASWLAYLNR